MSQLEDLMAGFGKLDEESILAIFSTLEDRSAVICAGSLLEDYLTISIAVTFKRFPTDDEYGATFVGNGPLATFYAKLCVGRLVGVLTVDMLHDLKIIKDIRNKFAHIYLNINFDSEEIKSRCSSLKLTSELKPKFEEVLRANRARFIRSVVNIMHRLTIHMSVATQEKEMYRKNRKKLLELSQKSFEAKKSPF
jgi:hypothetical protein